MPIAAPVFTQNSNDTRRGGSTPRRFLTLFLIALMSFLAYGCGDENAEGDSAAADSGQTDSTSTKKKKRKPKRASVTVAEVSQGDLVSPIPAEGAA